MLAALFAVLVFLGTLYLRIPLPLGYMNLGDCFVTLSAVVLPGPYAAQASAVGAALADVLSGYTVYAPATLVIKGLMAWTAGGLWRFGQRKEGAWKGLGFLLGAGAAECLMVGGYFVYDLILYGWPGALASLTGNALQGAAAVVVGGCILAALRHGRLLPK